MNEEKQKKIRTAKMADKETEEEEVERASK